MDMERDERVVIATTAGDTRAVKIMGRTEGMREAGRAVQVREKA